MEKGNKYTWAWKNIGKVNYDGMSIDVTGTRILEETGTYVTNDDGTITLVPVTGRSSTVYEGEDVEWYKENLLKYYQESYSKGELSENMFNYEKARLEGKWSEYEEDHELYSGSTIRLNEEDKTYGTVRH